MAYIGADPADKGIGLFSQDTFTGDGSTTTFDMTNAAPDGGGNEMNTLYDVQNTSNNKIRFSMEFQGGSNTTLIGDSSGGQGRTTVMFIRLGDT